MFPSTYWTEEPFYGAPSREDLQAAPSPSAHRGENDFSKAPWSREIAKAR